MVVNKGLASALRVLFVLLLAGTGSAREAKTPCCFTNLRYAGTCQVVPAKDETCPSILEYLNHLNSAGKAYCGATDIRGGWEQATCKVKKASIAATPEGRPAAEPN